MNWEQGENAMNCLRSQVISDTKVNESIKTKFSWICNKKNYFGNQEKKVKELGYRLFGQIMAR